MGVPPELAERQGPIQMTGLTMFSASRLQQDKASGATYIDVVTCTVSWVCLAFTPLVADHSMPALLGEGTDSN